MLEMGIVVGIALLFTMAKMSWKWRVRMTSNPLVVDVLVFIGLCAIHWGTYAGVMVATIGALFCSIVLSIARRAFGYIDKQGKYQRGYFDVENKL